VAISVLKLTNGMVSNWSHLLFLSTKAFSVILIWVFNILDMKQLLQPTLQSIIHY